MSRITFRQVNGEERTATAVGGTLMELAVAVGVKGIEGQCRGSVSCGTCHVHLPVDWLAVLGPATATELAILEFEPETTPCSRLSCQIEVTSALDGLIVHVARS